MCTIMLLVVNGQDATPGFDRLHRHQFLPSEFMEAGRSRNFSIGQTGGNLVKIGGLDLGLPHLYGLP